MKFTDIFIRRPVLAAVVSLLILLLGLRALQELPLRQFPKIEDTTITVLTAYPGASAELVKGFITTPLQQVITGAEGIDYITAESTQSASIIKIHIVLNYDPNKALTDIMSKVAQVRNVRPRESDDPVIQMATGRKSALMYLSFFSEQMTSEQITDYLSRVVQPKLETVAGVAGAEILGNRTFAIRIWLNPKKMAALQIIPQDVAKALRANNYQAAVGRTKGRFVEVIVNAHTDLHSAEEFRNIVIKSAGVTLIRIRDIAEVELGSENYDSAVVFNGEQSIFIAISPTPTANPLNVIQAVRDKLPAIQREFPPVLSTKIVYDATRFIRESIGEVIRTIGEASLIVVLVIFLFLGSLRSVAIPIVTIPLSLIGGAFLIYTLGYSINLLTLLAMVLAIGLVVDDAIVVVENIHRHIEAGLTPLQASIRGAREIATPIISMTISLAAVYTPIGFMKGLTGSLFKEFAFTLAGSVIISGVIALTLSPMMCSRLLLPGLNRNRFSRFVDMRFARLQTRYRILLHGSLNNRTATGVLAAVVLISCYFLYSTADHELAPTEDQGALFISAEGPVNATLDYITRFTDEFNKIFKKIPATKDYFIINGRGNANTVFAGLILKPWSERKRTQTELQTEVQAKLNRVAGLKTVVFPMPSLPGSSGGLPVQFVVSSMASYQTIYQVARQLVQAARNSGLFVYVNSDLKFDSPRLEIHINRSKAAALGITMQDIGSALSTLLGENYINRFSLEGRSYKVIPQVPRKFRLNPEMLLRYKVRTSGGKLIALSNVATLTTTVQPNTLRQFQQLNSATLQAIMRPGVSIGQGLNFLQQQAKKMFPQGFTQDYAGESRQFMQEGHALLYTFFFAIIVIFLVLAAQFESFRDPLIILISVPLSVCGALIPLNLGAATINIYTQVGLVTLIGLISKHGILIVEFANQVRDREGLNKRAAIEKSASIRLRPILMTTGAMVLGVLPLILARGAGSASRFDIGLVIATGMLIGTLFTLFVVPVMYTLLAANRRDRHDEDILI
jgi:multidrug efflux pump